MNILLISPLYPPNVGGLQNYCEEIGKEFAKKGHTITIFTTQTPKEGAHTENIDGVHIIRFPVFEIIPNYPIPKIWTKTFWKDIEYIRNKEWDVALSMTRFFITTPMTWILTRTKKIPWVHVEHGSDFVKLNNPIYTAIAKLYDYTLGAGMIKKADYVVAIGKAVQTFTKNISKRTQCEVIYRGIHTDKIDATKQDEEIRKRYKDKTIIMYAGRLIDGKGLPDLLKALKHLEKEHIHVFIIGDGPKKQELKTLTKKYNLQNKITFTGFQKREKVISLIKAADIIVNPSYTEGLPTIIIEAALCKKAIIATDTGGTNEIITHNKSGILIKPHDIDALTKNIQTLSHNKQLQIDLGNKARQQTEHLFNWDTCIQKFTTIFQKFQ